MVMMMNGPVVAGSSREAEMRGKRVSVQAHPYRYRTVSSRIKKNKNLLETKASDWSMGRRRTFFTLFYLCSSSLSDCRSTLLTAGEVSATWYIPDGLKLSTPSFGSVYLRKLVCADFLIVRGWDSRQSSKDLWPPRISTA
jgi:hypothetical protein